MANIAATALSFISANVAAAAVSVQTNDYGFSAFVGGITLAIGATCTMIVVVSPMIAKAIREGFPPIIAALNELRKQFEETRKSTYTGQIDELKEMTEHQNKLLADLKEDNARVKEDLAEANERAAERDKKYAEREQLALEREERLEDNLEKARQSLHEIRKQQNADILTRDDKIIELEGVIQSLRDEVARLTNLLEERSANQDKRIDDNAAAIQTLNEQRAGDAA